MLDAEEYFHLALHASAMGDHHACMTHLEEVLQRQPRNARAIYLLAVQHAELGLLQRAVAGIKTALMIEPDLELRASSSDCSCCSITMSRLRPRVISIVCAPARTARCARTRRP